MMLQVLFCHAYLHLPLLTSGSSLNQLHDVLGLSSHLSYIVLSEPISVHHRLVRDRNTLRACTRDFSSPIAIVSNNLVAHL